MIIHDDETGEMLKVPGSSEDLRKAVGVDDAEFGELLYDLGFSITNNGDVYERTLEDMVEVLKAGGE